MPKTRPAFGRKLISNFGWRYLRWPLRCWKRNILFFLKDPKSTVSHLGPNVEALAIPSIVVGGVTGTPVALNMSVTDVQGHTQDVTAPHSQGNHERPEIGNETRHGMETRILLSPTPPDESKAFTGSLPTPVNVNSLEMVLTDLYLQSCICAIYIFPSLLLTQRRSLKRLSEVSSYNRQGNRASNFSTTMHCVVSTNSTTMLCTLCFLPCAPRRLVELLLY